jgi:hypothetical protein
MASIDRICHMLLLTIFLPCFSFLMQARRDRWETKVCDKPFHDGIISCMCVCCRSLLVLLSFSFCPLFFFDSVSSSSSYVIWMTLVVCLEGK